MNSSGWHQVGKHLAAGYLAGLIFPNFLNHFMHSKNSGIVRGLREFAFGVEIARVFYPAAGELDDLFNFIIHYLLL